MNMDLSIEQALIILLKAVENLNELFAWLKGLSNQQTYFSFIASHNSIGEWFSPAQLLME